VVSPTGGNGALRIKNPNPKAKPAAPNEILDRLPKLTKRQRNALLQGETGTAFDLYTRMFAAFRDGEVFETGEWKARDLDEMLRRDGEAAMLEAALTMPIRAATYTFEGAKGDKGELELVQRQLQTPPEAGGLDPDLTTLIGQMSGATYYRKAFFEKKWEEGSGSDEVVLKNLAWRPPATCEVKRNEHTAAFEGFRQRAWWFSTDPKRKQVFGKNWDGYIDIPRIRAFVFIHGVHRQPLTGTSDLDISYWCYKQKQKILFLWFQFLEQQSLPKIAAYGPDPESANQIAEAIATMKASGVAGFQRPPQGSKLFDIIASSGAGAQQFQEALRYLAAYQTKSTMTGFLELGNAAALGRGSYALSESQSQFFLQMRQAVVKEICAQFTRDVIAPLTVLNFGSEAAIPKLTAEPLTNTSVDSIINFLQAGMVAPQLKIPDEFLDLVAEKVGTIFNLPEDRVHEVLSHAAEFRQKQAAQQSAQGASPQGQGAAKIAAVASEAGRIGTLAKGGVGRSMNG
jgi:hypothetical protein